MAVTLFVWNQKVVVHESEGTRVLGEPKFEEAAATGLKPDGMPFCAICDGGMTSVMAMTLAGEGNVPSLCWQHRLNLSNRCKEIRL
ncbi:hypothetical protein HY031_00830 [Candidatus Gottesmanbacteria bacterium]|nr:hypothetical protein [Candidatus Gottesmanbacteria bacterium]